MEKKKVGFASGIGFILAAAGSAIGLGNLWAFPYKTAKNGGAAFVFAYVAFVIIIGFVTMLTEIHLGRRAQANTVTSFKKVNGNLGFAGLVAIVVPYVITCYYSVLGGYTIKYTVHSFGGNAGMLEEFSTNVPEVLIFTAVFIALAIIVIMCGVKEGIERASKVLMPALFIILLGVVVYSLTLGDGVAEGLRFYLKPDFAGLGFDGVLAAMGQAFFSLSLGMGIMITYGSYVGEDVDIVKSTGMICIFDTVVALLAGLAIFPAVAHFDPSLLEKSSGIGLIFAILPDVFESMGVVGNVVSFLFFAMVTIAALTSVISLIEVATQFVIQKFRVSRKLSAAVVALFCFAVAVPVGISLGRVGICGEDGLNLFGMDVLTFLDEVTNTVIMPASALLSCIAVGWLIKPKNAVEEMRKSGTKISRPFEIIYSFMIKFVTPVLVIIVEVFGVKAKFDGGQAPVVYVSCGVLVLCAAVYFIFFKNRNTGCNADEK